MRETIEEFLWIAFDCCLLLVGVLSLLHINKLTSKSVTVTNSRIEQNISITDVQDEIKDKEVTKRILLSGAQVLSETELNNFDIDIVVITNGNVATISESEKEASLLGDKSYVQKYINLSATYERTYKLSADGELEAVIYRNIA